MKPRPYQVAVRDLISADRLATLRKFPDLKPMPAKPKKQPATLSATQASDHALADAVEYAKGYGNVTAIAEKMSQITGENVTRQMVGRWLNEDPEKRQQPSFGNAILILIAVDILRGNTDPGATTLIVEVPAVPKHATTKTTK